jgi:ElaA protein
MTINWKYKNFTQLSPYELYDGLQLRSEVFVVEQNCVFLDTDNIDQHCFHLFGYHQNKLLAYARIVPPGIVYIEPSIGRVVTSPSVRKNGIGKQLMQQAIAAVKELYGDVSIKIGAQFYLKNFYGSFGFYQISDVYLEDGIEHIYMLKNAAT